MPIVSFFFGVERPKLCIPEASARDIPLWDPSYILRLVALVAMVEGGILRVGSRDSNKHHPPSGSGAAVQGKCYTQVRGSANTLRLEASK